MARTRFLETFLVLLIGIGPKIALVRLLQLTASLDAATRRRVQWKMLTTAATAALTLILLGELLRIIFHFTVAAPSIVGGVILLVLPIRMVLEDAESIRMLVDERTQCSSRRSHWPYRSCSIRSASSGW